MEALSNEALMQNFRVRYIASQIQMFRKLTVKNPATKIVKGFTSTQLNEGVNLHLILNAGLDL